MPPVRRRLLRACATLVVLVMAACTSEGSTADADQAAVDSVEVPELGACRNLTPDDVAQTSDASPVVDCTEPHTAETYAVGSLPERFDDAAYDDKGLGRFAYGRCGGAFEKFLGADESLVMRTVVSWAWFRPTEKAWADGARWYRCDVIGGGEQSREYVTLPTTAKGLLLGRPEDRWLVCADGPTVAGSVKVPCSEQHTWRAVTTIKVGLDSEPYPGDQLVEAKTREFCSDSVGAWMNYPVNFEYAYTWFHEAEWEAGNRRSICWAKTDK